MEADNTVNLVQGEDTGEKMQDVGANAISGSGSGEKNLRKRLVPHVQVHGHCWKRWKFDTKRS